VIGVDKDTILRRFLTSLPVRMEAARDLVELHAVIVEADPLTGRCDAIRRFALARDGRELPA
jgi:calcineurin-like phosphoesterase